MTRTPPLVAAVVAAALLLPGCMALGNASATPTEYYGGTSASWNAAEHSASAYPEGLQWTGWVLEPVMDTVLLPVVAYRRWTDDAAAGDPNHEFED